MEYSTAEAAGYGSYKSEANYEKARIFLEEKDESKLLTHLHSKAMINYISLISLFISFLLNISLQ